MPASESTIELKGSVFTLLVLRLLRHDLAATAAELQAKVAQAPGFFANAPVVVDIRALEELPTALEFDALKRTIAEAGLVPVGLRNGNPEQQRAALAAGFGLLPESKSPGEREAPPKEREERGEAGRNGNPGGATARPPAKVVSHQVRSGQQLYAPGGDLVILGAVGAGAEVLADGNIHVYGTLRGRALAGVRGDAGARIFCRGLEAELVSIAGSYRPMDDIDEALRGKPVQILLDGERLLIEPIP